MTPIQQRLRDADGGPVPPLDLDGLHVRAVRRRRRRRAVLGAVAAVVVALVAVPVLRGVDRDPGVVLDGGDPAVSHDEALGVLGGDPVEDPPALLAAVPDLGSTWLAASVDGRRVTVSPHPGGGFCVAVTGSVDGGEGVLGCEGVLQLAGLSGRGSDGLAVALAPDGFDEVRVDDGRALPVTGNVIAIPYQVSDGLPAWEAISGPDGRLEAPLPTADPTTHLPAVLADAPAWPDAPLPTQVLGEGPASPAGPVEPAAGSARRVATAIGDVGVWEAAAPFELDGDDRPPGLCLSAGSGPAGVLSCGTVPAALHASPFIATASVQEDDAIAWVALVPDQVTAVRYVDGSRVEAVDNLVVVPDLAGRPTSALVELDDGSAWPAAVVAW